MRWATTREPPHGMVEQSQTAQHSNNEANRELGKRLIERGVPPQYYSIKEFLGFAKTNTTVRGIYNEMILLDDRHEPTTEFNQRWVQEETYKGNVQKAIELLCAYQVAALEGRISDVPTNFQNWEIKVFIGAAKTNNTVRAIAVILQEQRHNPWDETYFAYALKDFVGDSFALRIIPTTKFGCFGSVVCGGKENSSHVPCPMGIRVTLFQYMP